MINKQTLEKLLELPNDRLVSMLQVLLQSVGVNISGKDLNEKNINKLRTVLSEVNDRDLERLGYLIEKFKKG